MPLRVSFANAGFNLGTWPDSFRAKAASIGLKTNGRAKVDLPELSLGGGEVWAVHQRVGRWINDSLLHATQLSTEFKDSMAMVVDMAEGRCDYRRREVPQGQ